MFTKRGQVSISLRNFIVITLLIVLFLVLLIYFGNFMQDNLVIGQ